MTDPNAFSPWVGWLLGIGALLTLWRLLRGRFEAPRCDRCHAILQHETIDFGKRVWVCPCGWETLIGDA